MALTNEIIQQKLTEKFGEQLTWETPYGLLTATAPADMNLKIMQHLYDDETLRFRFMTDLTAVHYPERTGEELCVVYLLYNMQDNIRLRLKVYVPSEKPHVYTASKLFSTANWMEREAYDFFGVNFIGHPNLIRIMNVDEMEHFPMRKEYEMEDPTRRDKDDEMFGRG
jgi:NADH-quinone oxidoreductase subunit C